MLVTDFEKELKAIDPNLAVVPNPNRAGLSNIKYNGQDICPIPSTEIKEEVDVNYRYVFPNGISARHNSRPEALARVEAVLKLLKTSEGQADFYGR